jgi:hypothetical protein
MAIYGAKVGIMALNFQNSSPSGQYIILSAFKKYELQKIFK